MVPADEAASAADLADVEGCAADAEADLASAVDSAAVLAVDVEVTAEDFAGDLVAAAVEGYTRPHPSTHSNVYCHHKARTINHLPTLLVQSISGSVNVKHPLPI